MERENTDIDRKSEMWTKMNRKRQKYRKNDRHEKERRMEREKKDMDRKKRNVGLNEQRNETQ